MSLLVKPNLVSTIIPVFNRPRLVIEAVESVIQQTHRPIEIIIVDDGSTDDTPEVLNELAEKYREVKLFRQCFLFLLARHRARQKGAKLRNLTLMATCLRCKNLQRARARARSVSSCVTCAFLGNFIESSSS